MEDSLESFLHKAYSPSMENISNLLNLAALLRGLGVSFPGTVKVEQKVCSSQHKKGQAIEG